MVQTGRRGGGQLQGRDPVHEFGVAGDQVPGRVVLRHRQADVRLEGLGE